MKRRTFLGLAASGGAVAAAPAPALALKKRVRWRLALGVPKTLPIWGPGIERFAERVKLLSGGAISIRVYGAGELVPALGTFEAVAKGEIQMGHSGAYYWQGKLPASVFFTSIPFGMDTQGTLTWIQSGGGQKLWDEMMRPHGVRSFACGATPPQMAGWFKKPLAKVEDLKGLKIRMPGLASKIYSRLGAKPVLLAGGEVYTSLATGVIDAVEWVGPFHDYTLGLHRAASYYYGPGWQDPGPVLELMLNEKAWNSLSSDQKEIIKICADETTHWMLNEFRLKNAEYLKKIRDEGKVTVARLPDRLLGAFRKTSEAVLEELADSSPFTARVYESYKGFQKKYGDYQSLTTF